MINLRLALRTLVRTPFVTIVAIVSLGLGIGANAAIFSLFDQMLLRPLPVYEAGQLVNLAAPGPNPGSQSCGQAGGCGAVFSYPMFRDLERVQTVFTGLAAHRQFSVNLAYKGQTLNGDGLLVSGSYFPVLGLRPALGRLIGPGDDRAPGESPVAVLGYDYWRTRFDQSSAVLNEALIVNGQSMTIVGVAPRGFDGTTLGNKPDVFVPITMLDLVVLTQVARMTVVGGVLGLAGALGLGRAAQALLFQLNGHDPAVLGMSALLLVLVAFGAGFIPAWRASQVDPMRALRYE